MKKNPFDLNDRDAYQTWREAKLENHPKSLNELVVEIADPRKLSDTERDAILNRCRRCNMAIYAGPTGENPDKAIIRDLGRQLGLERLDHNTGADEDAITSLKVQRDAYHRGYIPYTDRPIAGTPTVTTTPWTTRSTACCCTACTRQARAAKTNCWTTRSPTWPCATPTPSTSAP